MEKLINLRVAITLKVTKVFVGDTPECWFRTEQEAIDHYKTAEDLTELIESSELISVEASEDII